MEKTQIQKKTIGIYDVFVRPISSGDYVAATFLENSMLDEPLYETIPQATPEQAFAEAAVWISQQLAECDREKALKHAVHSDLLSYIGRLECIAVAATSACQSVPYTLLEQYNLHEIYVLRDLLDSVDFSK